MDSVWRHHANDIAALIDQNEPTKVHLYLEILMLLPFDVQDKIINEISRLPQCSQERVEAIISKHSSLAMPL